MTMNTRTKSSFELIKSTNFSNWMTESLSSKFKDTIPLKNWIIPGAHDTASGCVITGQCPKPSGFLPFICGGYKCCCSTQSLSLDQLMEQGARFMDIRMNYFGGNWEIVHGKCRFNIKLTDWITSGINYAKLNCKNEVFTFYIVTDGDGDSSTDADKASIVKSISDLCGGSILQESDPDAVSNLTYNQIRSKTTAGQPTIILYFDQSILSNNQQGIFKNTYVDTHYGGQADSAKTESTLDTYVLGAGTDPSKRSPNLNVLQGFLQQPTDISALGYCIIDQELKFNTQSHIVDIIGSLFQEFLSGKRYVNIVIFNNFQGDNIMPDFILFNNGLITGNLPDPSKYKFRSCSDCPTCKYNWLSSTCNWDGNVQPDSMCTKSNCVCKYDSGTKTCVSQRR
jgi:hypothetical protein